MRATMLMWSVPATWLLALVSTLIGTAALAIARRGRTGLAWSIVLFLLAVPTAYNAGQMRRDLSGSTGVELWRLVLWLACPLGLPMLAAVGVATVPRVTSRPLLQSVLLIAAASLLGVEIGWRLADWLLPMMSASA